jgi:hypothetical protein
MGCKVVSPVDIVVFFFISLDLLRTFKHVDSCPFVAPKQFEWDLNELLWHDIDDPLMFQVDMVQKLDDPEGELL